MSRSHRKRHAQVVADWTEAFADPLWEEFGYSRWPTVLICDSTSFSRRTIAGTTHTSWPRDRAAVAALPRRTSFHLLVAVGSDPPYRTWRPVLARAVSVANQASWVEFFSQLDGRPDLVVADRDFAIHNAATAMWPLDKVTGEAPPRLGYCLHHVKGNFFWPLWTRDDATRTPREEADRAELRAAFEASTRTEADWRNFVAVARRIVGGADLEKWLARNGLEVKVTEQLRRHRPGEPVSNSAVEASVRWFKAQLNNRRFTNKERTNRLLRLMVLHQNNRADAREWSHVIRRYAGNNAGRTTGTHRTIADPLGKPTL